MAHFLAGLMVTGSVRTAVAEAGIEFETAWALRGAEPEFAMYWDRALRVHKRIMGGMDFLDAVAAEEAGVRACHEHHPTPCPSPSRGGEIGECPSPSRGGGIWRHPSPSRGG